MPSCQYTLNYTCLALIVLIEFNCLISINLLIKGHVSSNKNNMATVSVAAEAIVGEHMSTDSPEPLWQS